MCARAGQGVHCALFGDSGVRSGTLLAAVVSGPWANFQISACQNTKF